MLPILILRALFFNLLITPSSYFAQNATEYLLKQLQNNTNWTSIFRSQSLSPWVCLSWISTRPEISHKNSHEMTCSAINWHFYPSCKFVFSLQEFWNSVSFVDISVPKSFAFLFLIVKLDYMLQESFSKNRRIIFPVRVHCPLTQIIQHQDIGELTINNLFFHFTWKIATKFIQFLLFSLP